MFLAKVLETSAIAKNDALPSWKTSFASNSEDVTCDSARNGELLCWNTSFISSSEDVVSDCGRIDDTIQNDPIP